MFEIGVLGLDDENEVVEEVFGFRNKLYILFRSFIFWRKYLDVFSFNIKFILWNRFLEISNNYAIPISYP